MSERRLNAFQRLGVVTTALTLVLVALGGAVRATGSGLACPDWPFCYGTLLPGTADIPPESGYALWNVWLEHSHRFVASLVGILVLALAVWALTRFRERPWVRWPALAALVLATAQAGLGALVVLQRLRAELVTAHLGMAMLVVACLVLATAGASSPRDAGGATSAATTRELSFARTSTAVAALAFVQILVGGQVTGLGAGLVYTDFPLMGGAVIPAVSSAHEAFHVAHRLLAYALAGAVVYLCARAFRYRRETVVGGGHERWLVKLAMWAATLVVVQIGIGVANLMTGTASAVVAAHLSVASLIWTVLVILAVLAYRWAPAAVPGSTRTGTREEEVVA